MTVNELTEYLKIAFDYKNKGDYKQSIDYFYKALAIENDSIEIMSELAFLYSKLCMYERSISFYEQILQKNPNDGYIKYKLALLFKTIKNYQKAEKILLELYDKGFETEEIAPELFFVLTCNRKYKKIITSFNKHSKKLNSSNVLYFVALAHYELGNKNTANEFFKKSFNNDEKNILPGIEIAKGLLAKGKKEQARLLALRLLKYAEDDRIYYLLAEISYSEENIDSAIKYYSYAINVNPKNAMYYFKLGLAFSLNGFFKEAEESYCSAINLDSENELYTYTLAYMYYVSTKYELSEKLVDVMLSKNPDNFKVIALKILISTINNNNQSTGRLMEKLETYDIKDDFLFYAKAMYYSKLNLWNKALTEIKKALKINNLSVEYNYQSAKFNYELGKTEESVHICERILNTAPKYVQALLLLAKINYKDKNYDKAQTFLDNVISLDKNIADSHFLKGCIFYEQGFYDKAIEQLKISMLISPDNEKCYAKIAECYYDLQNYQEAYFYFKEAAELNITKAKYYYYMAKCSEFLLDNDNALTNYSIMKRLSDSNIDYLKDYANFLEKTGKKRKANSILKSLEI